MARFRASAARSDRERPFHSMQQAGRQRDASMNWSMLRYAFLESYSQSSLLPSAPKPSHIPGRARWPTKRDDRG